VRTREAQYVGLSLLSQLKEISTDAIFTMFVVPSLQSNQGSLARGDLALLFEVMDKLLLGPLPAVSATGPQTGDQSQPWIEAPLSELLGLPWVLMQTGDGPGQVDSWTRMKTRCLRLAAQLAGQLGPSPQKIQERILKSAIGDEDARVRACAVATAPQMMGAWTLEAAVALAAEIR
jgi:hypothetical protein